MQLALVTVDIEQPILDEPQLELQTPPDMQPCTFVRWRAKGGEKCTACSKVIVKGKYGYQCSACLEVRVCDRKCQRVHKATGLACGERPAEQPEQPPPMPMLTDQPVPLPLQDAMRQQEDELDHAIVPPAVQDAQRSYSERALLEIATAVPALQCVKHVPRTLRRRIAPLLLSAVQAHGTAHYQREKHSGLDAALWEETCSMWCWILPALLKRIPTGTGQPCEDDGEEARLARRKAHTEQIQTRVAQAEMGEWHKLLVDYVTV